MPASSRASQEAKDVPLCNPYSVKDGGSARSRGNEWRVCWGMREHAPMLTSSVGRRGVSLAGLLASCRHDAVHEVGVARSSRCCLLMSQPSFHIIVRPYRALGCSHGRRRHLNRHRARLSLQVGEAPSSSTGRLRDRRQPFRMAHGHTQGSPEPAGHHSPSMWRSGYPRETFMSWMIDPGSVRRKVGSRGHTFHCLCTA